jgi:hypothetical protein
VILFINGRDIATLGLSLADQGALWASPQVSRGASQALSRVGGRPTAYSVASPKVLSLNLALTGDVATRRNVLDTALAWMDGLLELSWSDAPGRVQYARMVASDTRARFESVAWIAGDLLLPVQLIMDVPLSFDTQATILTLGTTSKAIPLGTATSALRVELIGAISAAVTLTYRNNAGEILSQLALANPALASGQTLIIDASTERIYIWTGTALNDANNLYVSGSFPIADPGDGNREAADWPTITATHAGRAIYRRSWE